MDRRQALAPGSKLIFSTKTGFEQYTILREIGRGGSCIVYDATYSDTLDNSKTVRIKECYPHAVKVIRLQDNSLQVDQRDAERFTQRKKYFRDAYQLQHDLFYSDSLMNSITNTLNIHEAYGTLYTVSTCIDSETLADHTCRSIHECIALSHSISLALQKIHQKGYLYLDLKPENILTIRGTTELVHLFDFDSPVLMSDLDKAVQTGDYSFVRISYSRGFASLEQATGKFHLLTESSDVYSLGAILFWLLWGRVPTAFDCEPDNEYNYEQMKLPSDRYQDKLFRALTDFFHHTLASYPGDRYQHMEDASAQLEMMSALSNEMEPWLISTPLQLPAFYVGRFSDQQALHALLHTPGHQLFSLSGMGGIGKSSMVRVYLAAHRNEYDAVVWMYDQGKGADIVADDTVVRVNTVEKMKEESLPDYLSRKTGRLRDIVLTQHALAVVDNVEPEHINDLQPLLEIGWDLLFISREALPEGFCPSLRLAEMQSDELSDLFVRYSHVELQTDQDREDLALIINAISGHTLTVELLARQIARSYLSLHEAAQLVAHSGLKDLPADSIDYVRDSRVQRIPLTAILDQLVELDHFTDTEKQIMKVLSLFDYQGIQIDLLRTLLDSPDLTVINELESCGWLTVNRKQVMLHPLMLEYIRTWSWDENGIRGADTAMKNLYQMIKPESGQTDADKQYVRNYSELAKLLSVAEQLIANTDYVSAPKQKLKYRVLMDAPVDQDESVLDRMLELLDNPVFLDDGRILRIYEWTAFLLNRLGRFPEAFAQLEKMNDYLSNHRSTFYRSLYHRAMATVLHDSDMYGNQAECQKHEDNAIFTARVSRHPEAKVHLAACLLDKAQNLISVDMDDEQAWNLLQEAKRIVLRYTGEFEDERYLYYCISAMYAAKHNNIQEAEQQLAQATRIADLGRDSDLAYIDHLVDQAAWIYRAMGRYDKAADVLKEAVEICAQHADIKRYYYVMISTWIFLDEIYNDAGEKELSDKAADEVRRLIHESPWPIAEDDPLFMR